MTRFMRELSGELGAYWKRSAEKELADVKAELEAGQITIDENGVARNCIGRVVMADMLEKIALVSDKVNVEATAAARDAEATEEIKAYRANKHTCSNEDMSEMRATFGAGRTVVNVLSGEKICL